MREQAIEAGEVLFREGEPSDSVYLILDGEVEILRSQDGRAVRLGTRKAGEIIGEMGVIRDLPRSATVRVVADAKVSRIAKDQFLSAFGGENKLALNILKMLCQRLGDSDRRIGEGELEDQAIAAAEAGQVLLLPGSRALESQIGHDGIAVERLPFRVGRRALPGEPTRIEPVELSLQAQDSFQMAAQHFAIEERDGRLMVRDLGSPLGTLVNGRRIAEFEESLTAPLRLGANEIQAGGTDSRFRFILVIKRG